MHAAYVAQQRSQTSQQQVVEMQQNLRSAMSFLSSEIRMAGYKPPSSNQATGITGVSKGRIQFTWEKDTNTVPSGPDMNIIYRFSASDDSAPADGVADTGVGGAASFNRSINGGGLQPVADNIVAVEFWYAFEDTTDNCVYDPVKTLTPLASQIKDIRAVTISLLARSANIDRDFTNSMTYRSASGQTWGPYDDSYRRRLLISTVQLRNIGL
jgi:type IV pilus assembly protein PilW